MTTLGRDHGEPSTFERRTIRALEEIAERLWKSLPYSFLLGLLFLGATGFYRVGRSELGVLRTLGKVSGQALPGFHFRIPLVQDLELVDVATTRRLRVGLPGTDGSQPLFSTLDRKLCAAAAEVHYRVTDAAAFTSRVQSPESALLALSEAALTETVARTVSEELFDTDLRRVERSFSESLQARLDAISSGVAVSEVRLSVEAPAEARQSLADVLAARAEKDELVARAEGRRETELARARAEAIERMGAARAYASERVEDAKANAERFEALRPEYARAPEVTRRRLELETARRVLEKVREKTIIDAPLDALPGLTHAPARPSASKASP